jgi:hypothetical protein
MVKEMSIPPQKTKVQSECRHHWVIESPSGATSTGICKHCGSVKEFNNYLPFSSWEDSNSSFKKRSRPVDDEAGGDSG